MARVKKTKTELKVQRDALSRFKRYLPTLELKKQQLRAEVTQMETQMEQNRVEFRRARHELDNWVKLFSEDIDFTEFFEIDTIDFDTRNIAGINVPVLDKIHFIDKEVDLFSTPPWVDQGIEMIKKLLHIECEYLALKKSLDMLEEELRITSQRVNLFEKVKIPEAKENIRIIKIALADEQTAAVVRAKMTKKETIEAETISA